MAASSDKRNRKLILPLPDNTSLKKAQLFLAKNTWYWIKVLRFSLLLQQHQCACFGFLITGNWCIFFFPICTRATESDTMVFELTSFSPDLKHWERNESSRSDRYNNITSRLTLTGKTVSTTHDSDCDVSPCPWATNPRKRSSSSSWFFLK